MDANRRSRYIPSLSPSWRSTKLAAETCCTRWRDIESTVDEWLQSPLANAEEVSKGCDIFGAMLQRVATKIAQKIGPKSRFESSVAASLRTMAIPPLSPTPSGHCAVNGLRSLRPRQARVDGKRRQEWEDQWTIEKRQQKSRNKPENQQNALAENTKDVAFEIYRVENTGGSDFCVQRVMERFPQWTELAMCDDVDS
jgi:hypothetical protein